MILVCCKGGDVMRNEVETKISAYLRLAELCGTGDETKKKRYMLEVEKLLQNQSESTLKENFLKWMNKFDKFGLTPQDLKHFVISDIVFMFTSDNNLNLTDEEYRSFKKYVFDVVYGDDEDYCDWGAEI